MIVNALHRSSLLLLVALCLALPSFTSAAEDPVLKFETFTMEGSRFRFNKETGELEKLIINSAGCAWVKQDVQHSNQQPTDPKVVQKHSSETPRQDTNAIMVPAPGTVYPPKAHAPADPLDPEIRIMGADNEDITDIVNDDQRKAAAPAITNYENKLSIAQTFNIGDHITGTILVRNSGDKRLRALELTMSIPVNGKSKPEERHFLFVDKSGQTPPPQPGANGKEGMPLLQKVDIPSPAGDVKGSPELRITFLQFAE